MARSFPSSGTPQRARPWQVSHPFAAGFRPAAAALAIALAFAVPQAPGQPVPAQVIHGTANFVANGSNLTVTTTNGTGTSHSAINWTSFSVPAGSVTQFVQPSAASTSINRVVAANPSQILGNLSSNGKLVLVNPWGITVGAGAQVDTAGFTASTLAMSDADALAGRLRFAASGTPGALQVDGTIRANGGDIVLIAPSVQTGANALVQSDGAVILAAGQQVEITGRGLEGIVMQVQAGDQAVNLGTLKGDAVGLFASTLHHSGLIQAQGVTVDGGKVVLGADNGIALAGDIAATDMYGGAGNLLLAAANGNIEQTAGSLSVGGLLAWAANGDVLLDQPNHVTMLAGYAGDTGSRFVFRNAETLNIGSVGLGPDLYGYGVNEAASKQGITTIRTDAGDLYVHGPVGGGSVLLEAGHTLDVQTENTIVARTGTLALHAGNTIMIAMQPGMSSFTSTTLEGATGLELVAGAGIRSSSVWSGSMATTSFASLRADGGSGVTISASGDVDLGPATGVTTWRAPVAITSLNGSILGQSDVRTNGTAAGTITLSAAKGSVQFSTLGSTGSYSAPQGGAISITAKGDVQGSSIWADGSSHTGTDPATGGSVAVTSTDGSIRIDRISANGGYGEGVTGGNAGDITLAALGTGATSGNITIASSLYAKGGGAQGGDTVVAGAGGHIALQASRDIALGQADGWTPVDASGGNGAGVPGGAGGSVLLSSTGGNIVQVARAEVDANGGDGSVSAGDTVSGKGGTITITAPSGRVELEKLHAAGGSDWDWDGMNGAAGGTVDVHAGGDIHLTHTYEGVTVDGGVSQDGAGAAAGTVMLVSTGGNILLEGGIGARGGGAWTPDYVAGAAVAAPATPLAAGPDGGSITLQANGTGRGAGNVSVLGVVAMSGGDANSGQAGSGGTLTVTADKNVQLSAIEGPGGTAHGDAVQGGKGGSVDVTSATGTIGIGQLDDSGNVLVRAEVQVYGGDGNAYYPAAGGDGGSVRLIAQGASGSVLVTDQVNAAAGGGYAGGGAGGSLEVRAGGSIVLLGDLTFSGGWDYNYRGHDGLGGTLTAVTTTGDVHLENVDTTGLSGGAVSVTSGGNIDINSIYAGGRYGYGQPGGNGGNVTLQALSTADGAGNILLRSDIESEGGGSEVQPGNGGTVSVSAYRDITLSGIATRGGYHAWDANTDGIGGTVLVDSQAGDISAGYIDTYGPQGGPVTVRAHQGNIQVWGINTSGSYSAGGLGAGAITLEALGTAEGRGNITVTDFLDAYGSSSDSGDGGSGGTILVHADKTISVGSIYAGGGSTYASTGTAGGGGSIDVLSEHGSIDVGTVSANGGYGASVGAGGGGAIRLKALGTGTDAGAVTVWDGLYADGGYSWDAAAGNGGSIRVEGSRTVQVWGASARGMTTFASIGSAAGGAGGSIYLSSLTGDVTVADGLQAPGGAGTSGGAGGSIEVRAAADIHVPGIDASGGPVQGGTGGGQGGRGGSVTLRFGGMLDTGGISANGSDGETGGPSHPNGGAGGAGGSIAVTYTGPGTYTLEGLGLSATGGRGGDGYWGDSLGSAGGGGRGGNGGTISVASEAGALLLRMNPETDEVSSLRAGAGEGGWNSDETSAAHGTPGRVNLSAASDLALQALDTDMLAGLSLQAGESLAVDLPIFTDGGSVTLSAPSLTLTQPIDTTGTPPAFAGAIAPRMLAASAVGTTLANGDVLIATDSLDLQTTVNAGTAHAIVQPLTDTRATRLGGVDDGSALHLSQDEINLIAARTLVFGASTNTGGVTIGGPIAIDPALASNLRLVSQGAITQDPGTTLSASGMDAAGGSVDLNNVTVSMLSGRAQSGAFRVANQGSGTLTIGNVDGTAGIVASGPVQVTTHGTVQLLDAISSTATGNAVVLVAPHLQAASTAAISAPSGRWLVYLDTVDGNDFGTLQSGHYALWNHTFAANPPATIADTGNRYLFGDSVGVDVAADPVTRVYDGTSVFALTFHATGFVDASRYQNAFLQDDPGAFTGSLAIANPGKDVGSYTITQGTLAGTYAIRSFTGNTATITPAPLTIQANNLNKEEGQPFAFSGTEFTPATTGIGDETITFVSLTSEGAASSAKAGAYPIKGWGATGTNGFLEGNYAITYLDGALAVFPSAITRQVPEVLQVNNQVVTFATLFVQEANLQASSLSTVDDYKDAKKKRDEGKDDIIVTNNVCK